MATTWKHGDKAAIARAAGISPQYLNDILKARKAARAELAKKIIKAAAGFGYSLGLLDLLDPSESSNPLIG